jgi:tellurite resistance protein TerC
VVSFFVARAESWKGEASSVDNGVDAGIWVWVGFNLVVLALLALDLGVFHRHAHAVTVKEAATWSIVWVALSLAFAAGIFVVEGSEPGLAFLTGYVIEKSLSVDNIFVFVLLFTFFAVPAELQHRVLFWGVLGALVMRGILIGVGSVLLSEFHWIIYVFGAVLIFSGIRMATAGEKKTVNIEGNLAVRLLRKVMPVSSEYEGQKFFTVKNGVRFATPLFLVLVVVETTDLIFAIDSIPAIFAVTDDPFLVYTSNVCAILGLRAMYFLLAGVVDKFHYLTIGLSVILVWVGTKMLLVDIYHVPIPLSLAVIAIILSVAVGASLLFPKKEHAEVDAPTGHGR